MTPASSRVPAPALVMPNVTPPMTPPRESLLPPTVIVRAAPSVMAPVVCVRFAVPVKVKSVPSVIALVIVALTEASTVPPLIVKVPAVPPLPPRACVAAARTSGPWVRVVPPV